MYEYNEELKSRIIEGDTVGSYPEDFEIIYRAELTDPTDRDEFFELFSFFRFSIRVRREEISCSHRFLATTLSHMYVTYT